MIVVQELSFDKETLNTWPEFEHSDPTIVWMAEYNLECIKKLYAEIGAPDKTVSISDLPNSLAVENQGERGLNEFCVGVLKHRKTLVKLSFNHGRCFMVTILILSAHCFSTAYEEVNLSKFIRLLNSFPLLKELNLIGNCLFLFQFFFFEIWVLGTKIDGEVATAIRNNTTLEKIDLTGLSVFRLKLMQIVI